MKKTKNIPTDSFAFKVAQINGIKKIALISQRYYQHFLNTKTKVGDKGTMFLTFEKPTRSESQLRYYWIVVGLLADNCGYTSEEMHEALMVLKFGKKKIKVGKDIVEVRKSISNSARFSKLNMMDLIEFGIEKAFELNIIIPSRQELGYISN